MHATFDESRVLRIDHFLGTEADRRPARGAGQYAGYRDEPGVDPGSQTETMAAVRAEVANWR